MSADKFVFFYGGPFSQWYRSYFEIDGKKYNCAEQYMMAQKAIIFNDDQALIAIMSSKDPAVQKGAGRLVRNFDADKWNQVSRAFVYRANIAKFSDPQLKRFILSTGNKELVEASPTDRIWGIGLAEGDPRCLDKSQWRGTNWLGEVLMQVRTTLMQQELTKGIP